MAGTARVVFGVLGNVIAGLLFLSPVVTFKRIFQQKSTEDFSGVPYVTSLLNCALSAWYGMPLVTKNNILLLTINGAGALIEFIYVLIFLLFSPNKERIKILSLLALVVGLFTTIALVSRFKFHGNARKLLCGCASSACCIIMYASPLSSMRMVIKTKSVKYMPFFLSLFVFLSGMSWLVYGLLGKDLFVTVPNAIGCGLGAIQLILYRLYCKKEPGDEAIESAEGQREIEVERREARYRD